MPGVEAERVSQSDTSIGLLSYFQEATKTAWLTHHEQHELEDKALELAVDGVKQALELAVRSVRDDQKSLRELLEAKIEALAMVVEANDQESRERSETRKGHIENDAVLWREDHLRMHDHLAAANEVRGQEWLAHLKDMQDEKQRAHEQIHAASQRAIDIASASMADKLGEMNQLRQQITAERGTYVNRDMLDSRLQTATEQTGSISKTSEARIASLERSQNIAYGILLVLIFAIPLGLRFIP